MITKLSFLKTTETNPYRNLALEEYLLTDCREGECILYLWQNRSTVVIGRNQNCWKECHIHELENDGGFLARRLSGGGAVYHDLGNLNFTFLARKEDYDVDRQMDVIIRAMDLLGLYAQKTGRNDAVINGRKFSGNAFYRTGPFCYHHGTLLISADTEKMSQYLRVSVEKLQSKGVASVRSRVANLSEFCPQITVPLVSEHMRRAFCEIYSLPAADYDQSRLDTEKLCRLEDKFSSWEWKYGRAISFQHEFSRRFSWGEIQIQLDVSKGVIQQAAVFSDAMDPLLSDTVAHALRRQPYEQPALLGAIRHLPAEIREDIKALILDSV
ncbi:MAG: lipoate--protein ligase [Eubacteriales bacterium]|nr:lipoate--protein ligase [Eubacteriales bacterium]